MTHTKTSRKFVQFFTVAYYGNENAPLMNTPVFTSRADAEEFARDDDGCGLRYGAHVIAKRITRADIDRYDEVSASLAAAGIERKRPEPDHIAIARDVLCRSA